MLYKFVFRFVFIPNFTANYMQNWSYMSISHPSINSTIPHPYQNNHSRFATYHQENPSLRIHSCGE